MKRWWAGALATAAVLVAAAACTSNGASGAAENRAAAPGTVAAEAAPTRADTPKAESGGTAGTAGAGQAGQPGDDSTVDPLPTDRQVVRTANLTVRVEVPTTGKGDDADQQALAGALDHAAAQARAVVGPQGYVGGAEGRGTAMTLTLRVPAAGYQAAMDKLATLGRVTDRQEQAEDVTANLVDLQSRIETMKASVARVRALLAKADKVGDVVAIESELSSREADLESLQRRMAALSGQASLSTITVTLLGVVVGTAKPVVEPDQRSGFLGGLANGWDALVKAGSGFLAFVGTILPFLPIVAVLVLAGWWARRRVRARQVSSGAE